MVSIRSYLFITALRIWNGCIDRAYRFSDFYHYVCRYFHEDHHVWYLYHSHSIPLSSQHHQAGDSPDWLYSSKQNRLYVPLQPHHDVSLHRYRPSWLSVAALITSDSKITEHSMDNVISDLQIDTTENGPLPTIYDLYRIWCIRTKHWVCSPDCIRMRVVTEQGDEITLPLSDEPLPCTTIQQLHFSHGRLSTPS